MTARIGLVGVALAGCGFPKPYTATMLAEDALRVPEKALVHYLSQAPPIDLSPCDPAGAGPHVPAVDARLVEAVDRAFAKGRIPVAHWTGCLGAMWRSADPALRERIASGVLLAFPATLEGDLEPNEALVRLEAIVTIVEERPEDARLPEAAATSAVAQTEAALGGIEDARKAMAQRFVAEVGLDLGRWEGAPVDAARVAAEGDTAVLARFAARLPDEALRAAARERIVRVRIAEGPWEEARVREDEVVRAVLETGRWALDPAQWPVRAVGPKEGAAGPEALVVVQDLAEGDSDLLVRTVDGVLSAKVDLAPLLSLDVEGLSAPAGLCATGDGLDPTPCVDPGVLTATHPLVSLDAGVLALPSGVPSTTALALARVDRVDVPVAVGAAQATLSWPVTFAPPSPLLLSNPVVGANGPELVVRVREEATGRLVYEVTRGETTHVVVAEPAHLASFRVITQGAEGLSGTNGIAGRPGMDGFDGADAACPYTRGGNGQNGGDGGDGGPGGPGGRGGNGGNVQTYLRCSSEAACQALLDLVEPSIVSRGGPGGPGGRGGEGGQPGEGGEGGDPAACTHVGGEDYVDGGYDGIAGLRGDDGLDGQPGPDGRSGTLTFKFVP